MKPSNNEQKSDVLRKPNRIRYGPPIQAISSCRWSPRFFYLHLLWNRWAKKTSVPLYEMRLYTYPSEGMPQVLEAWGAAIPERVKFSPLAGCWYSEYGGVNNFIHIWAYKSFEERARIRAETREKGVWRPPKGSVRPITQESKLLLPAPVFTDAVI